MTQLVIAVVLFLLHIFTRHTMSEFNESDVNDIVGSVLRQLVHAHESNPIASIVANVVIQEEEAQARTNRVIAELDSDDDSDEEPKHGGSVEGRAVIKRDFNGAYQRLT